MTPRFRADGAKKGGVPLLNSLAMSEHRMGAWPYVGSDSPPHCAGPTECGKSAAPRASHGSSTGAPALLLPIFVHELVRISDPGFEEREIPLVLRHQEGGSFAGIRRDAVVSEVLPPLGLLDLVRDLCGEV